MGLKKYGILSSFPGRRRTYFRNIGRFPKRQGFPSATAGDNLRQREKQPCLKSRCPRAVQMITLRPGSHAYRLLLLLAICGEYPHRSLHLLGSIRTLEELVRRLEVVQHFRTPAGADLGSCKMLTTSGKGNRRTIRLYKSALPLLQALHPAAPPGSPRLVSDSHRRTPFLWKRKPCGKESPRCGISGGLYGSRRGDASLLAAAPSETGDSAGCAGMCLLLYGKIRQATGQH